MIVIWLPLAILVAGAFAISIWDGLTRAPPPLDEPLRGPWQVVRVCSACRKRLTRDAVFYAEGACIHCGNLSPGTVTATDKVFRRFVVTRHRPPLAFWRAPEGYWERQEGDRDVA